MKANSKTAPLKWEEITAIFLSFNSHHPATRTLVKLLIEQIIWQDEQMDRLIKEVVKLENR